MHNNEFITTGTQFALSMGGKNIERERKYISVQTLEICDLSQQTFLQARTRRKKFNSDIHSASVIPPSEHSKASQLIQDKKPPSILHDSTFHISQQDI